MEAEDPEKGEDVGPCPPLDVDTLEMNVPQPDVKPEPVMML